MTAREEREKCSRSFQSHGGRELSGDGRTQDAKSDHLNAVDALKCSRTARERTPGQEKVLKQRQRGRGSEGKSESERRRKGGKRGREDGKESTREDEERDARGDGLWRPNSALTLETFAACASAFDSAASSLQYHLFVSLGSPSPLVSTSSSSSCFCFLSKSLSLSPSSPLLLITRDHDERTDSFLLPPQFPSSSLLRPLVSGNIVARDEGARERSPAATGKARSLKQRATLESPVERWNPCSLSLSLSQSTLPL